MVNVTLINQLKTELTTLINQTITDFTTRLDNFDKQLEDITDKTTKINMISEDGTSWALYIDNYGQIGVIKG